MRGAPPPAPTPTTSSSGRRLPRWHSAAAAASSSSSVATDSPDHIAAAAGPDTRRSGGGSGGGVYLKRHHQQQGNVKDRETKHGNNTAAAAGVVAASSGGRRMRGKLMLRLTACIVILSVAAVSAMYTQQLRASFATTWLASSQPSSLLASSSFRHPNIIVPTRLPSSSSQPRARVTTSTRRDGLASPRWPQKWTIDDSVFCESLRSIIPPSSLTPADAMTGPRRTRAAKANNATVVTAFYDMRSKHTKEEYWLWSKNMLGINTQMVVFVDDDVPALLPNSTASQIRQIRICLLGLAAMYYTRIVPLPRSAWVSSGYTAQLQAQQDSLPTPQPDGWMPMQLRTLYHQKAAFVRRVASSNPFNTRYFVWTDVGCFRDDGGNAHVVSYIGQNWPDKERLKVLDDNRVLVARSKGTGLDVKLCKAGQEVLSSELVEDIVARQNYDMAGAIWAGTLQAVEWWAAAYYRALDKLLTIDDRPVYNDDQTIMTLLRCWHPRRVRVLPAVEDGVGVDVGDVDDDDVDGSTRAGCCRRHGVEPTHTTCQWFFLQLYLRNDTCAL